MLDNIIKTCTMLELHKTHGIHNSCSDKFKILKNRRNNTLPYLLIPHKGKSYYIKGDQLKVYNRATRDKKQLEGAIFIQGDNMAKLISTCNGVDAIITHARKNLPREKQAQIEKYFFEHYT